ncbi:MAG: MFS transporter [Alphaproteobacteria bacterium]|nr:MFS transporter [Alphaproteobacteria bacterium]
MASETAAPKVPTKAIAAVVIGNWLEFYDFIVFSFFAVMIAKAFFPPELITDYPFLDAMIKSVLPANMASGSIVGLLAVLATFWTGFLTRPIGAVIIGAYADRVGRKAAMTFTIMLMAVGTAIVAFTPGYATIGIAAPILLIVGRLIQGFSCGGEVGPATSYLLESAQPHQRAALTSWQGTSQQFAGIAGTGLGLALAASLSEAQLYDWGWRVPFIIGILIGPVGFYIRRVLPETMDKHEAHETSGAVLGNLFAKYWWTIILAVFCIVGPTISTYVFGYMTTYAIKTLNLSPEIGMLTTLSGYIAAAIGIPIGAWASDKFGVKVSILVPRVLFLLIVFQGFVLMTTPGASVQTLLAVNIVLNFLMALSYGGLYVLLTEGFPKAVRSSGLSIAYAVSVTVFGGSTQLVIAYLIETFQNPLVPAYYQIAANIVSVVAVLLITIRSSTVPAVEAEAPG